MSSTKQRNDNGSGSIYFHEASGRWKAEISWTDYSGKTNRKSFSSKKKTDVRKKLEEFKKQLLLNNGTMSGGDVLFEDFAKNWMQTKQKLKLKPTSFLRKEVTLNNQVFPLIGNIPIDRITHEDVQGMVSTLSDNGLSYSTVKKAYQAVNGCLKEYRLVKRLPGMFNPCEGVVLPENTERPVSDIIYYDEGQRKKIIEEATRQYSNNKPVYRMGWVFPLLLFTGMRLGEVLALTWQDIDFKAGTITVNKNLVVVKADKKDKTNYKMLNQKSTKTNAGRVLSMNTPSRMALMELKRITGSFKYVVCTQYGKQIRPRNIERNFHNILKKTGLLPPDSGVCGVHTLRHTFASMLFQNGCDVKTVSELLGHADTKITENIYIHLIQKHKAKAMQNLDQFIS